MKVNRVKLLNVLQAMKPAIASKEILEQSTHICFDGDIVRAYNDSIAITAEFETGIKGTISALQLISLLDKIPTKKVKLEFNKENNMLGIITKNIKAAIKLETEIKLPILDLSKLKKWQFLPKDFCSALSFAIFSASQNMGQLELTGIYIEEKEVISCDNFRATKVRLKEKIESPLLIPSLAAIQLIKYNPIEYICQDTWLHFKCKDNIIFSCRTIEGKYPIESILKLFKKSGKKINLPVHFERVIDRIQVLVDPDFEQDKVISLCFTQNQLICKGEGGFGWVEETIDLEYQDKEIKVQVHPQFLIEILKHLKEIDINESLIYFKGENFEHVISTVSQK